MHTHTRVANVQPVSFTNAFSRPPPPTCTSPASVSVGVGLGSWVLGLGFRVLGWDDHLVTMCWCKSVSRACLYVCQRVSVFLCVFVFACVCACLCMFVCWLPPPPSNQSTINQGDKPLTPVDVDTTNNSLTRWAVLDFDPSDPTTDTMILRITTSLISSTQARVAYAAEVGWGGVGLLGWVGAASGCLGGSALGGLGLGWNSTCVHFASNVVGCVHRTT